MPLSLDELKKLLQVSAEKFNSDSYVKVGFEGTANRRKTKKEMGTTGKIGAGKNQYMPTSLPIWKLAVYNHKRRPFLAETAEKRREDWENLLLKYLKAGFEIEESLSFVGALMQGDVRRMISRYKEPPNSPKTVKIKGKNSPLRDSGAMLQGVRYQVINKRKGDI